MRLRHFCVVVLMLAAVAPSCTAAETAAVKRDDSAAERLGFKVSLQCWTFNKLTLFETIDKAAALGIKYLEMIPRQKVKPGSSATTNYTMSDEVCDAIKQKLADAGGLRVVAFGVSPIPTDEPGGRKVFDWAKKMGIEVLVTETPPNEVHDKLSAEYHIKMALHNHPASWPPDQVLAACKDRGNLIGCCCRYGPLDAGRLRARRYDEENGGPHLARALQGSQ